MSNAKHTPGPWNKLTWEDRTACHISNEHGIQVCMAYGEANARLIAAAPDLLAALEALLKAANNYEDLRHRNGAEIFNARDAIAKAKGT